MKFEISALLALGATLVSAQEYNTSPPFTLTLSSDDSDISGQYLEACHSGAAIEELCLAGKDGTPQDYNTFNLNVSVYTTAYDSLQAGILVWTLHGSNFNESEGLVFESSSLFSNVITPQFQPSYSGYTVGFDDDNKLFIYSPYYDESDFTAGEYPSTTLTSTPQYHWYACYTYSASYYYQTLSWVTNGEPTNPTCEPVNVTRIFT